MASGQVLLRREQLAVRKAKKDANKAAKSKGKGGFAKEVQELEQPQKGEGERAGQEEPFQ